MPMWQWFDGTREKVALCHGCRAPEYLCAHHGNVRCHDAGRYGKRRHTGVTRSFCMCGMACSTYGDRSSRLGLTDCTALCCRGECGPTLVGLTIRRGRRFVGRGRLLLQFFSFPGGNLVFGSLFEIADSLAQRRPDVGEFAGAEYDEHHCQDHQNVGHAEHRNLTPCRTSPCCALYREYRTRNAPCSRRSAFIFDVFSTIAEGTGFEKTDAARRMLLAG